MDKNNECRQSKFKKTIYLLETEQYEEASIEMLDSLWAKQTPNRAIGALKVKMRERKTIVRLSCRRTLPVI